MKSEENTKTGCCDEKGCVRRWKGSAGCCLPGEDASRVPEAGGFGEARGWPVVGTGMGSGNREDHVRWCRRMGLPAESHDFSTHDVFDVLEFLIERDRRRQLLKSAPPDPDPEKHAVEERARIAASLESRRAALWEVEA